MLCITNTKLFRGPNVLIPSMYPNVHTKKSSFFWTPCMAEIAFYELNLSIFEKGSTNLPHHKGKTFQETQYFDHFHTYQFLHQNKSILHFSPCMAKIAFYQLEIHDFEEKAPQIHHITKAKPFKRPNILIISIHFTFCTKIRSFCIFWTPCMAKVAFYQLCLSIL